jgi:transposase
MTRLVRKYTNEFKSGAIKLALQKPSISEAARDLGIPAPTLHSWIDAFKGRAPAPTKPDQTHSCDMSTLIEENRRLQKELAIAKEEREILKKAAAYFAQHQK